MRKAKAVVCAFLAAVLCTVVIFVYRSTNEPLLTISHELIDSISLRQISLRISLGDIPKRYKLTETDFDVFGIWPDSLYDIYRIDIPCEDTCRGTLYVAVPNDMNFSIEEKLVSCTAVTEPELSRYNYSYLAYSQYGLLGVQATGESVSSCISSIENCLGEIVSLSGM